MFVKPSDGRGAGVGGYGVAPQKAYVSRGVSDLGFCAGGPDEEIEPVEFRNVIADTA